MKKLLKFLGYGVVVLAILAFIAIWQRHYIMANLFTHTPPVYEKFDEGENVKWFDDWYTIEQIAPNVYAIGEPRYWQRNYNYLIIGEKEALLFDAGPGVRDINKVVKSLTNLPYAVAFSHLHFDHMGNGQTFPKILMADLPHIKERTENDVFQPNAKEHLGHAEGLELPKRKVDRWLKPNDIIDLGNHKLEVIYTPGHTTESISLYDEKNKILFSGDWFLETLLPALSNSSMKEFLKTTEMVICRMPEDIKIYPAHKYKDGGGSPKPLHYQDLVDTKNAIIAIEKGELKSEGFFPAVYKINDRMSMNADITFFQKWGIKYPELLQHDCK